MNGMLLGISPDFLYLHKKQPKPVSDYHRPYFLAFCPKERNIESARKELLNKWENNTSDQSNLSKIEKIGDIESYRSFWRYNEKRNVFRVYTKQSYFVPEVSDYLFFNHGFYTAEHDIPYHQRALIDLAAEGKTWIFDSGGKKEKLNVLVYDIETTQYEQGNSNVPIDIIGHTDFDIAFESDKNLESEEFSFDIIDCPTHSEDIEVRQLISRNIDEEIENLYKFCKLVMNYDIISGHNIAGFDNLQIYNRINWILKTHQSRLSDNEGKTFQDFINKFSRRDRSFHFGVGSEIVNFYPCSFDTYHATRKFYSFLNSFSLKAVAPFLGVGVKDRIILTPSQMKIDDRTLKYNKHDVIEQMGVTLNLIQQALPLSFTTCMPFETLLPSGAVNMWDHMALLRGSIQKKIIPATCRASSICKELLNHCNGCTSREEIVSQAKQKRDQLSKEFVRVLKYGKEMPEWVKYPYVVYNRDAKDADERLNYHMPGGMTIKPDKDVKSHFIPWYKVVIADVGAMYPTILKALNIGADTVRLCPKDDTPDMLVWFKRLPQKFFENVDVKWRKITEREGFADKGFMIGIKIDKKPGVVNCAMTGIMSMIQQIKNELQRVKSSGDPGELKRLKMMYQSVKGARNAGTHGILSAPNVSGRQFNLWGAGAITTKGQVILDETIQMLQKKDIRVTYGDTDGIYMGCSRSVGNLPKFSKALGVNVNDNEEDWLTKPEEALSVIKQCNSKWQEELNYPEFELEPEHHDAMIFVKHKNYLIFDEKDGKIVMNTKGNNFKGSDKANIARKVLKEIMINVLKEIPDWTDEKEARNDVRNSIKSKTKEILLNLDLSKVDIDDLTLIQSVKPAKQYKTNQDGAMSTFGKRAAALEKLLDRPIKSRIKLKFVVTKKPIPDIAKPSKSGVKPIDYMYPMDLLEDVGEIDLKWYKKMIENYIQGAFGLSNIEATEQKGLDAWM